MHRLSVKEAAEHYGKTEQTIRRWCRQGRLDADQIGREWLIYVEERPARVPADEAGQSDEVLVTSTLGGQYTWSIY